jgi:cytidine deaminase
MSDRQNQFYRFLETLPQPLGSALQSIPKNNGRLDTRHCAAALETAAMSPEDLMIALLPAASLYARVPISNFTVGAVARARLSDNPDDFSLFLGANIEFTGQSLSQTIHAEQTAVVNAWQQGSLQIDAIAVSAAPCGRCRQFLYELETRQSLTVMVQNPDGNGYTTEQLLSLMPQAFGGQDLSIKDGWMSLRGNLKKLNLKTLSDDPHVHKALTAAERTYAPYTHNLAGCAIQTRDQQVYIGAYVENAAFNPSLSPLHSALICMNMDGRATEATITRAILVEKPTSISQRGVSELLLGSLAPSISLEYYEIR